MHENRIYIELRHSNKKNIHMFMNVQSPIFQAVYDLLQESQESLDINDNFEQYCWAWAETKDCEKQLNQVQLTPILYQKIVTMLIQ
jgi:hypothetical protein